MHTRLPAGKQLIHATNDERDLNKSYPTDHPVLGDAKLVLRQFIEAIQDTGIKPSEQGATAAEIQRARERWLRDWTPKLSSSEAPITPYRVIWEFLQMVDPAQTIVTHDSGSPRNQLLPFYQATTPRGYMGLGQVPRAGDRTGADYGSQTGLPGEVLC